MDTTPFVDDYWSVEQQRNFDWRGIGPRQEYLDAQLEVNVLAYFHLTECLSKEVADGFEMKLFCDLGPKSLNAT